MTELKGKFCKGSILLGTGCKKCERCLNQMAALYQPQPSGDINEEYYCVSSDALVYGKPCEKWCGVDACKALLKPTNQSQISSSGDIQELIERYSKILGDNGYRDSLEQRKALIRLIIDDAELSLNLIPLSKVLEYGKMTKELGKLEKDESEAYRHRFPKYQFIKEQRERLEKKIEEFELKQKGK